MFKAQLKLGGMMLLFISANSFAADSVITITGYVRDNTCAVATESKDFVVDLMNNTSKSFSRVGATTPLVPFRIILSPCGGSVTTIKVKYSGVADNDNSTLLKIDSGVGSASGMGVQILDENRNVIPMNSDFTPLWPYNLKPNSTNILNFYARLMASRVPVIAGHVQATATFTLEYQ
ncbi:TPA: fimbrial protein [Klebsiella quasipneumoniae subsp. similipneumoniae]